MDYLEGFLIGPVWSDTEYQTRRHTMVHIVLASLVAALYVALLVMPSLRPIVLIVPVRISAVAFVLLMFLTPFLSAFYYRIPAFIRTLMLVFYIAVYAFGIMTLLHLVLPLYQPDVSALSDMALERINERIDLTTGWFTVLGPMFSMVTGIIMGGLWLVGEGLLVVIGIIAVPLLLIVLIKSWRRLFDLIIVNVFFAEVRRRR